MIRLQRELVEKPWGRTELPAMFGPTGGRRIGEVWFTGGGEDLPLLAKYIFTSERLSIQVHPDDAQARARGLAAGQERMLVHPRCRARRDARPRPQARGRQGRAARRGARRLDRATDGLAAGRGRRFRRSSRRAPIHAIGAGISLLEFQQNADVTYRLYDYGRPRELHLDDGIAVADAEPFDDRLLQHLDRARGAHAGRRAAFHARANSRATRFRTGSAG